MEERGLNVLGQGGYLSGANRLSGYARFFALALTLGLVLSYQACQQRLFIDEKSLAFSRSDSGNGGVYGGMQSLLSSKVLAYSRDSVGQLPAGTHYYRLMPGNMCLDSSSGSDILSHAGHIFESNGDLFYEASQCSPTVQSISGVEASAYDHEFFTYLNGIFQQFQTTPDPAVAPNFNKVFCRNSSDLSEGVDVIIQEDSNGSANVLTSSSDLTQAPWGFTQNATVTPASIAAPDGTSTVYKFAESTVNDFHQTGTPRISGLPDNEIYTMSVFAKAAGRSISMNVGRKDAAYSSCGVNLTTGLAQGCGSVDAHRIATGIVPYPNGWYWVWVSYNIAAGTTNARFYFELDMDSPNTPIYAGDGSSGIYLANAKVEKGSAPGPLGAFAARIIKGQQDPTDGVYRSRQVSPFEVRQSLSGIGRSFGSDVFNFALDIQGTSTGRPLSGRLRTIVDQQALDLNVNCWLETN